MSHFDRISVFSPLILLSTKYFSKALWVASIVQAQNLSINTCVGRAISVIAPTCLKTYRCKLWQTFWVSIWIRNRKTIRTFDTTDFGSPLSWNWQEVFVFGWVCARVERSVSKSVCGREALLAALVAIHHLVAPLHQSTVSAPLVKWGDICGCCEANNLINQLIAVFKMPRSFTRKHHVSASELQRRNSYWMKSLWGRRISVPQVITAFIFLVWCWKTRTNGYNVLGLTAIKRIIPSHICTFTILFIHLNDSKLIILPSST